MGLYIWGSLGDKYDTKKILIVALILINLMTGLISVGGFKDILSIFYFLVFFSLNGAIQSTGWPCCVAIFANWFGKKNRGLIFGIWTSCGNMGNIIGSLMTSFLTETLGFPWYTAYAVIGCFCTLFAILNFILLEVHPEDVNLHIQEID